MGTQQKHLIETEHPKQKIKMIGKKIFTQFYAQHFCLSWPKGKSDKYRSFIRSRRFLSPRSHLPKSCFDCINEAILMGTHDIY